jgi:integrase
VPTPAQVRELFAALTDGPEFALFLRLSTTAGLRPSEICALRWLDVDLDAATVSITGSIVTAKDLPQKYAWKDPKSRHGERLLALDAATAELLRAQRARCEQLAAQFDGRLSSQAYVFARTPDGRTPLRPDTSDWWAPDGSALLRLGAPSIPTDQEGSRRIGWITERMIKCIRTTPTTRMRPANAVWNRRRHCGRATGR